MVQFGHYVIHIFLLTYHYGYTDLYSDKHAYLAPYIFSRAFDFVVTIESVILFSE